MHVLSQCKEFLESFIYFILTLQESLASLFFFSLLLSLFRKLMNIKCVYKCKRSICYLPWLHCEKAVTCFLAKTNKSQEPSSEVLTKPCSKYIQGQSWGERHVEVLQSSTSSVFLSTQRFTHSFKHLQK